MKFSTRIIQNYYLPEQLKHGTFEPYYNPLPTPLDERYLFCESDVIRRLVLDQWHLDCDYFGVLGYAYKNKLLDSRTWGIPVKNISRGDLDPASLLQWIDLHGGADFLSFGRFVSHRVFEIAEQTHPGWRAATRGILDSLGIRYDLDRVIRNPIYFNFFVGRPPCLEAYVRELLSPAIEAAVHDPEIRQLCFTDAGYYRQWSSELSDHFQINHYPLHPFIGERLINIYTDLAGCSVSTYDLASGPLAAVISRARKTAYQAHWQVRQVRTGRSAPAPRPPSP